MKRIFTHFAKNCAVCALLAAAFAAQVASSSASEYQIIPTNQMWKYIIPTDNTFCLNGTSWETVGFNDASWAGPAPGGFTGGETVGGVAGLTPWINTTTLPAPTALGGRPYYFRTHFTLANINNLRLFFTNRVDDQAVWYINGVRVHDLNHPNDPETCDPAGVGGGEANTNYVFMLTEAQTAGIVVVGDNVLAVSVHQNGPGSSDMVFGTTMWGQNVLPDSPITITNNPASQTVAEGSPATFTVGASGDPLNYYWLRNGSPIPGAPNDATYTLPAAAYPGDNGAVFSVIVSNSTGPVTSGGATLTVTPDTTPPTVISAIGDIDPTLVHVTFSEPMDPAFINEGNFTIFVTGTFPGDYFTYGITLTNGTNVTITTDPRLAGQNYTLEILDVRDASSGNNQINPNPLDIAIRPTVQLIGFDADNEWKYFIGSDIFGTGWEQPGYDDSTWASGPSGLGLDVSANGVPIRTTIPYTAQSEPSWYRKHFTFPGSTNGAILTLRDVVEDSAVYFLNGQEVFRHNVGPGALTYATRAATTQVDPTPIQGPFNIPATNLISGDNVLAVVVIEAGATSSDVELAVELTATIQQFAGGPPHIIVPPVGDTVNEGGSVTFTVSAEGAVPLAYQWRHGVTDIPGANSPSYTINGVVPGDAGSYSVFISNSQGNTNSPAVTLTVIPDTTAPRVISAVGDTNLSIVTVTLNDPAPGTGLKIASVEDPSHYQIHLTAGGGNLTVISATSTTVGTNTVVTLTTSAPRTANQDYTIVFNNVTDNAATPNAVTPNTVPIVATVLLLPFDSTWRYDQTGNDLGTAWKDVAYSDVTWAAGRGVLGFETTSNTLVFLRSIAPLDGTNTILSLSNVTETARVITYYFRAHVNLPLNPAGATVQMKAYIDDGAILYVNGIEQWRYNMTNGPGYTNLANAALTEPTPAPVNTYVVTNLGGLVQGDNVIAVEVHQDSTGSSDIDFGLQLEALVNSFNVVTGPRLNISRNPTTGQVTIGWTGGGILQQASALPAAGAPNWTDVPGNPNPYVFTPTPGQNQFFSLRQ